MAGGRVARHAHGKLDASEKTPAELAIETLASKSVTAPARLTPADLGKLTELLGFVPALEVLSIVAFYHFFNRMSTLIGIRPEAPLTHPRWKTLSRISVRLQGWSMRWLMGASVPVQKVEVASLLREMERLRGGPLPEGYRDLREAPRVAAWAYHLARAQSSLSRKILEPVDEQVSAALPTGTEDAGVGHRGPTDPVGALARVGTRHPSRVTQAHFDSVRTAQGWDDGEMTELVFAIAVRNAFERVDRLLAHPR